MVTSFLESEEDMGLLRMLAPMRLSCQAYRYGLSHRVVCDQENIHQMFQSYRCTSSHNVLTHSDEHGKAKMVDISEKAPTKRQATAVATVSLLEKAFKLVQENQISKGDVLTVANLAGIMGAKECHRLIPLCHHVPLSNIKLNLSLCAVNYSVKIEGTATCVGQTGVEMEALTAVSIAALTVYDMCKAVTQDIVIGNIHLVEKKGGKSGHYRKDSKADILA